MKFKRGQEVAIAWAAQDNRRTISRIGKVSSVYNGIARVDGCRYDAETGQGHDSMARIEPATDEHRADYRRQIVMRDRLLRLRALGSSASERRIGLLLPEALDQLDEHLEAIEAIIEGGER